MRWRLRAMREADLPQVLEIESQSFRSPWRRKHFEYELRTNPYARNSVVVVGTEIIGYASVWCIGEELRINNLAVAPAFRRRGLGGWMLKRILDQAVALGCSEASLEVRPSNRAALALYERHRFRKVGLRKGYYAMENEDAIVMARPIGATDHPAPSRDEV